MNVKRIAEWFPSDERGETEAIAYLKDQGVYAFIDSAARRQSNRIQPKYRDLARLHLLVRRHRLFTIMEFGVGLSSVVLAHALALNKKDWDQMVDRPNIRLENPFELHSIDTSEIWIQATQDIFPEALSQRVYFHHSDASLHRRSDGVCHLYDQMPNVIPDFIYIDGPDPATVNGALNGVAYGDSQRLVMSGDLLDMEAFFVPGTLVLVDGRTANARFLAARLKRNGSIFRCMDNDVTVMGLMEKALGIYNRDELIYKAFKNIDQWAEPLNYGWKKDDRV